MSKLEQSSLFGATPSLERVADPPRRAIACEQPPTPIRQLNLPAVRSEGHTPTLYDALPRLFHRGGRYGRELRDGILLSGAPRPTGPDQYSFRQRRSDGRWRLVTVFTSSSIGVIKSITGWSPYLPNHEEAA